MLAETGQESVFLRWCLHVSLCRTFVGRMQFAVAPCLLNLAGADFSTGCRIWHFIVSQDGSSSVLWCLYFLCAALWLLATCSSRAACHCGCCVLLLAVAAACRCWSPHGQVSTAGACAAYRVLLLAAAYATRQEVVRRALGRVNVGSSVSTGSWRWSIGH